MQTTHQQKTSQQTETCRHYIHIYPTHLARPTDRSHPEIVPLTYSQRTRAFTIREGEESGEMGQSWG